MAAPNVPSAALLGGWIRVGRRVHRLITVPAGAVVVACVFLPFVTDCDHTVTRPADHPILWPWFGLAALIAIGAVVPRRAWARAFALIVELAWYGTALVWIAATGDGLGALLGALAIAAMVAVRAAVRDAEARLASEAVLVAVVCGGVFSAAALFLDGRVGAELAMIGEGWLLIGAIVWHLESSGELRARGRAIVTALAVVALASYAFVLAR